MRSEAPLGSMVTRYRLLLGICLGFTLPLTSASPGAAQLAILEPGSRVRISAPIYGIEAAVGTVQDTPAGALIVGFESLPPPQGATAWTLRNSNITDLEVSIAQRRYGFKGFGIGFFSGLVVGAAVGLLTGKGPSEGFDFGDRVVPLARAFALAGGVTGLIIGGMKKSDIWVPTSPARSVGSAGPPLANGAPRLDMGFALPIR